MKLSFKGQLQFAARAMFAVGSAYMASIPTQALAQTTTEEESAELETYTVTGSRLRRVDTETASPVYTMDRATIESSGVTSLGELVQEMPSISGAASNPAVNNGGGDGGAYVSLRGLGSERTLILLNGRRLGSSFDINSLPISAIERVEVLKEGAGAVYGSDAVGGVVNFITRADLEGVELEVYAGTSDKLDGDTQAVSLTFGTTNDRGHLLLSLNYNTMEAISAGDRAFSENALYYYKGYGALVFGSSRTPQGFISLPSDLRGYYLNDDGIACSTVTRIDGAAGSSLDDYRCYNSSTDSFNYQPYNLIMTPQERGGIFATGAYDIGGGVEIFSELLHNFTTSGFEIAPLPFDARNDNVVISEDSIYNPFGASFGGSGTGFTQFLTRFNSVGNRMSYVETTVDQISSGIRGGVLDTSWTWEVTGTYQRYAQKSSVTGYLLTGELQSAVGPSFIADDGTPTCGTPDAPIAGCTPLNIFNLDSDLESLSQITAAYDNRFEQITKSAEAAFSGDVLTYAPGTITAAISLSGRQESLNYTVDGLTEAAAPDYQTCNLAGETCSGSTFGSDSLWEAAAEVYIPLVSDKPFAKSLNLILGTRYSDYESFGDTTNSTAKLEWRPFSDLMIRGTYAQIFRSPTIFDRFAAPTATAAPYSDPCNDLTFTKLNDPNTYYELACENVTPVTEEQLADELDGVDGFTQENSQTQGLLLANEDLDPETGYVATYGFVYDASWAKGLSMTLDFWQYTIDEAIVSADPNVVADQCIKTGEAQFCDLITRYSDGQVQTFELPTANAATFTTEGIDLGLKYDYTTPGWGRFGFKIDVTYTDSFEYKLSAKSETVDAAGTYDPTFGNYAQFRSTAALSYMLKDFYASWTTRYISSVEITGSEGAYCAYDFTTCNGRLFVGDVFYHDVIAGYTFPTNTTIMVGAENVFDKQPPLFYQFALNANTNVETYDTIGAFYYMSIKQTF